MEIKEPTPAESPRRFFLEKAPVVRVIFLFTLFLVLLEFLLYWLVNAHLGAYKSLIAGLSTLCLDGLGQDVVLRGNSIVGRHTFMVEEECLALHPTILFAAIVLAFPARILRRLIGVALGSLFLQSMNVVRVVSLYFVGVYFPDWLRFVHVEVWQFTFVILAFLTWLGWVRWALKTRPPDA